MDQPIFDSGPITSTEINAANWRNAIDTELGLEGANSHGEWEKAVKMGLSKVSQDLLLVRSMFNNRTPISDIMASYNDWLERGIRNDISGHSVEYKERYQFDGEWNVRLVRIQFEFLNIIKPKISGARVGEAQTSEPMFPAYAKIYKVDYRIKVLYKIRRFWRPYNKEREEELSQNLIPPNHDYEWLLLDEAISDFELPSMIGSRWCNTVGSTPNYQKLDKKELLMYGSDPEDPGTYFIIDGLERFMPLVDKPQKFTIHVLPPDSKSGKKRGLVSAYVKQTVDTKTGTAQNQIIMNAEEILCFQSNMFGKTENTINNNSINILHVFNLLMRYTPPQTGGSIANYLMEDIREVHKNVFVESGSRGLRLAQDLESYKKKTVEIFTFILKDMCPKHFARIVLRVSDTIDDYQKQNYRDVENKLFTWLGMGDKSTTQRRERMHQICSESIFPNINQNDLDSKFWQMGMMTVRLVLVQLGVGKLTSRNEWHNKYLLTAGAQLSEIFKKNWNSYIKLLNKDLKKLGGNEYTSKPISLATILSSFKGDKVFTDMSGIMKGTARESKSSTTKKKSNLTSEILESGSPIKRITILSKISSNIDPKSKSLEVRSIQIDQPGLICLVTTPDDKKCGLDKFKAITCTISLHKDFFEYLLKMENESLILRHHGMGSHPAHMKTPLLVNGTYSGWCNGETLYDILAEWRREKKIPRMTSFTMTDTGFFEIFSTAGRLMVPVSVVTKTGELLMDLHNKRDLSFDQLVKEGYIVWMAPDESRYRTIAARPERLLIWKANLDSAKKDVMRLTQEIEEYNNSFEAGSEELIRVKKSQLEARIRRINWLEKNPYHYCSLHGITFFSPAAAVNPFNEHNAACRGSYSAKLGKQGLSLGVMHEHNTELTLVSATHPLVDTALSRTLQPWPNGHNIKVAILADYQNKEDAIVVSQKFVENWMYTRRRQEHAIIINDSSDAFRQLKKPSQINPDYIQNYAHLTYDGLPAIGAELKEDDRVIGIVETNKKSDKGAEKDISVALGIGESGRVVDVIVREIHGKTKVSVLLEEVRHPQEGDKFTSRYSQKVTIGVIRKQTDMPFVAYGPAAGRNPDILINPHCLPSRMTIGKILEFLGSLGAVAMGEYQDATTFEYFDEDKLVDALIKTGYHSKGNVRLRDGNTGELMESLILMSPIYYLQLPHIAKEKIQARGGTGRVDPFTEQALGGRALEGGVRYGEMEAVAAIVNQAAEFLRERLFLYTDKREVKVCLECGSIASFVFSEKRHQCPLGSCAATKGFAHLIIPKSFMIIQQLLLSVGLLLLLNVDTYEDFKAKLEHENSRPFDTNEMVEQDILLDYEDNEE